MNAAGVWNCAATALALHIWFEPLAPHSLRIDAAVEIGLLAGILNISLPLCIIALVLAVGTAIHCKEFVNTITVVTIFVIASLAPALIFWQMLVRDHEPMVNLWKAHIWWCIGC